MPPKLTQEFVKAKVESYGGKLLSPYTNSATKITVECPGCQEPFDVNFHNFLKETCSHILLSV